MSNHLTGTFLVKSVIDPDFGPYHMKIELEPKDGKSVFMGCKKSVLEKNTSARGLGLNTGIRLSLECSIRY